MTNLIERIKSYDKKEIAIKTAGAALYATGFLMVGKFGYKLLSDMWTNHQHFYDNPISFAQDIAIYGMGGIIISYVGNKLLSGKNNIKPDKEN